METVKLRVGVVALFVDGSDVLLLHQTTLPEPDCWDLPGGGLQPEETLLAGLRREVQEETGLVDFRVEKLLTIAEDFFPHPSLPGATLHALNLVYLCSVHPRPTALSSNDVEVSAKGIQWLPIASLTPDQCSTRSWKALQAAGLVPE